jgi:hypothetical protein
MAVKMLVQPSYSTELELLGRYKFAFDNMQGLPAEPSDPTDPPFTELIETKALDPGRTAKF